MKKFAALLLALVVVGLVLKPDVLNPLIVPLKLRSMGVSSTADSEDYQRKLEEIAPKGTQINTREMTEHSIINATIKLPTTATDERIRPFLDKAQAVMDEQAKSKKTYNTIFMQIDGKNVNLTHESPSTSITQEYEKAQQLVPRLGDRADSVFVHSDSVSLGVSEEYRTGTECANAMERRASVVELEVNAISFSHCAGAFVYVEMGIVPRIADLAAVISQFSSIPEGTSLTAKTDGTLTVHYKKELPDKAAFEQWPHGEVQFYAQ